MAEAVILRAIESLDCWLVKKEESNLEKVYSLIVGMSNLGEEKKEMVHTLLLQFGMEKSKCERERKKEKLYKLLDLNNEKMYNLVVGMADFWEDYKGKLYRLLFQVGNQVDLKVKLYRLLHSFLVKITNWCRGDKRELKKEKLHRLLVEITDLWGDDEGELNKENLHSLLFQMLNNDSHSEEMSGEVAGLWKDKQPKLNKEKLYTWLTNKLDLYGAKYLFSMLLDIVLLYNSSSYFHEASREGVEGAKRGFRMILDLVTDKKLEEETSLRYFISSDVVDMAHHARFLIQLQDSDPFVLYFELSEYQALEHQTYYKWFSEEFKHITNGLQEIKVKLENVGSNMAEAVILSVIESLDCWLIMITKRGLVEENWKKLNCLVVGMPDWKKEMVHSLLLQIGTEEHEYEKVSNIEKMTNLLDLDKEKMYSLVVRMADVWEDYKGKLYRLLILVAKQALIDTNDFLVEIADLWGDDEGELNKEKLHNLLFQMVNKDNHSKKKMMYRISGEVAGLWKDKQPKMNKEKLYTWLANKLDLCEPEKLFRVLYDGMLLQESSSFYNATTEGVEGAKTELRLILDLITNKKLGEESSLRYFISDVVDMAHHAHFLIQLEDSDPYALFFELSEYQYLEYDAYYKWFDKKIKHIVRVLQEIKVSMLGFRVERLQNVRGMEGRENVVGLEEDVKSLLSNEANSVTVITGMVGSGKTTLARQLYSHTTIQKQFQCRAWVCLSAVFSRKEMLVSLVRQVVDNNELASLEKIECADYDSLKQVLHQQLLGMSYFIVLDDMWKNTTHYEYVTKALPRGKGNRLLLTTRSTSMSYYGVCHKMKSMDADNSWTLLLKTLSIEGSNEQLPKPLVGKARQTLRKCGGLPLAIKEVGRNWAKERQSGIEWEKVIESIDLSETLGALESTYHDWRGELKSCFLHLAFFKEGATSRARKLVQIWIIMGIVSRYEEMYQSCLKELFRESIIDVIDMDNKRNIKTCCIHPVFHMLSITKAKDELNLEILSKDGNNQPSHQPHHRVIYCSREKLMNYSSNQNKYLVSLFLYGGGYFNASPYYWKHFERLKTLDMEDFGLKILPDVFGMLTELRYLGLRNNYIQELPPSLSRLKKLEVLDLALNFMVEVEDIIWEMDSLLHLYMTDTCFQKPLRIDTLKNLKTWTYVSVHSWMYEASRLEMLMSLTKLGIQEVDENTNVSKLFASLAELKYLEFLIIRGFRFKRMPSLDDIGILRSLCELKLDGLITGLPSANNFPPKVKYLSLVNSCLHEDPMPILEKLSSLTYLKLQNAYTGQQMVISDNGFFELESLVIEELWHLTNVQIEKGAMKKLKDIEINSCPNLETLPEDYLPMDNMEMFKMKTTKKNATKIRESSFVSRIKKVDIHP